MGEDSTGRWGSVVAKSILKAKTNEILVRGMQRWKSRRPKVHFSEPEADLLPSLPLSPVSPLVPSCDKDLFVDTVVSINTVQENSILRLPPLGLVAAGSGDSEKKEKNQQQQRRPSVGQQSWAERQLVKVKHRKLWCLQEKTADQQQQIDSLSSESKEHRSLKFEENADVNKPFSNSQATSVTAVNESIHIQAWHIAVDKEEEIGKNLWPRVQQNPSSESDTSGRYKGWPEFPRSIADKIQRRDGKRLAGIVSKVAASGDGCGRSISESTIANSNSSSFARRRRFGKKILMSLLRRRKGGNKGQFNTTATTTPPRLIDRQTSKNDFPVVPSVTGVLAASSTIELEKKETTTQKDVDHCIIKNLQLFKKMESDLNFDDGNEVARSCCSNPSAELDASLRLAENNDRLIPDCVFELPNDEADVINKAKKQVRNALTAVDNVAVDDCHCVHRAVLSCLLPDTSMSLGNLESIRRQLRRTRHRHQRQQQQPQH